MLERDLARFGWCKTVQQFVQLLQNWTSGCGRGAQGVQCKVLAINRHYSPPHRVILWPQAFYMSSRTMPICYHPDSLEARIQNQVGALTLCRAPFKVVKKYVLNRNNTMPASEVCAVAQQLYDEDHRLWSQHCDDGYP
jgi:hypothetical protein